MGPWRGGHEEHGRDDPHRRGRHPARGGAAGARPRPGVLRRRGERRGRGLRARREGPAGVVRRRDGCDQRGRRLLDIGRRSSGVPAAGGGEGPDLDPPRRHRSGGTRQPSARGQRRHEARRGRRRHRPHPVAGPAHADHGGAARGFERVERPERRRPRRPRRRGRSGRGLPAIDVPHDDQPDGSHRRLQAQRHPGARRGADRRPRDPGDRGRRARGAPAHRGRRHPDRDRGP